MFNCGLDCNKIIYSIQLSGTDALDWPIMQMITKHEITIFIQLVINGAAQIPSLLTLDPNSVLHNMVQNQSLMTKLWNIQSSVSLN